MSTKINLNQKVKVKITPWGKNYLRRRHKGIFGNIEGHPKFKLPDEDAEGYSVWQLWYLTGQIGGALQYPTLTPPIDPEIELILIVSGDRPVGFANAFPTSD